MANNDFIMTNNTSDNIWELNYTVDTNGAKIKTLKTAGTFVDRDIKVTVTTPLGTVTPAISNTNLSTYFNSGTSSNYNVILQPTYSNTAGYVLAHSGAQGNSSYYKIKIGSGSFSGTATNGSVNLTITNPNSIRLITDIAGKTAGTDYWTISANTSTTAGSYTPKYIISTAGWMSTETKTGTAVAVNVTNAAAQNIYIPKATFSVSGNTITATAGYIPNGQINATIDNATVKSGTAEITNATFTYNNSTSKFDITGSSTVAAPSVVSAGYISSSIGTKQTNTAILNATANKIVLSSTNSVPSGKTATLVPSITKQSTPSGVTNAADGSETTTAPTSGVYVAVKSAANTTTLTSIPSVTTEGYGTTSSSTYTATAAQTTIGAAASSTTYIPIKIGTAGDITGGSLTHSAITTTDTTYLTSTNTGYAITFNNTASRAAAAYSIDTAGWISSAGNGLAASGNSNRTLTKYIKAGSLKANAGTVTLTVGSGDSASSSNTSLSMNTSAPTSGIYYTLTATGKGNVGVETAGWVPTSITQNSNTATTFGYINKSVYGNAVSGSAPPSSVTNSVEIQPYGYIVIPAGYFPQDRCVYANKANVSNEATPASNYNLTVSNISGESNVTVGSYNSTSAKFPITANNLSVTATLTASNAGWFSSGSATDSDTDGSTVGYVNRATLGVTATGATATTTVAPGTVTISANTTSISGKTRISSTPTYDNTSTTLGKYYIAAKANAAANSTGTTSNISGSSSASVTTAGYADTGLTASGRISGTATAKTSSKDSNVYYFPVAEGSYSVGLSGTSLLKPTILRTTTTVSGATNVGSAAATTTAPTGGYFISVRSGATTGTATATASVSTTGYIESGTKTTTAQFGADQSDITYIPIASAVASANTASADVEASDADGSNAGKNIYSVIGTKTTTEPTSGYYIAMQANGSGSSKITTAGWIQATTSLGTASTSVTKYFPITESSLTFSGGALSASTSGTATAAQATIESTGTFKTTNGYGVTTTKPSGTDGSDYLTIDGTLNTVAGSVSHKGTANRTAVTYTNTAGYIPAHTSNQTASAAPSAVTSNAVSTSVSVTSTDNFSPLYQPIVKSISFSGGVLSAGSYTGTPTISLATGNETNIDNIKIGAQDTTNYPYYFKVNASSGALSSTIAVNRSAFTYTNIAGAISAHTSTQAISNASTTAAVTVNSNSNSSYISLKKATATVSGTNTVTPSVSLSGENITISETVNNGIKIDATGGGEASVTATARTNVAGYAPANNTLGSATLSAAETTTQTRYISGVTLRPPASGESNRSFTITVPNGSVSEYISFVFTVDSTGNVTVTEA